VLTEELAVMTDAYHLRAPGQRGIHRSAWGSFLGQLLLRSMDRAEELYASMRLRGYHGAFYYAGAQPFGVRDGAYPALCAACFLFFRLVNVAQLLGSLFVR
ncbi:MAG: cobalt ECF transporter T component CbiQ, partial [Oscillospiraceae bacterium]|nr:cobalt ECF transporter T component CbiQ [Oscillospiraceae bacterium]